MQDLLDTNQYVLEETFTAKSAEVFQHLTRLGSVYSLGCDCATGPSRTETSTSVKFGVGFAWREHRRQLFLREVTDCEVTHCQAPVALRIITSDGE